MIKIGFYTDDNVKITEVESDDYLKAGQIIEHSGNKYVVQSGTKTRVIDGKIVVCQSVKLATEAGAIPTMRLDEKTVA